MSLINKIDWKLIGQWILIIGVLIGSWITMDRRVTMLEVGMTQEQNGYNIVVQELNKRLDRLENKIDILMQRG